MFKAVRQEYLVPFDGSFRVADAPTSPPAGAPVGKGCKQRLGGATVALEELQRVLFADNRWSLLLVFQALDAAGKDGTIRAVFGGVDPTGCQAHSFRAPSAEELDHDFLWRTTVRLPERGRIGIFNRSYYEEVLVVRVHPEYLAAQRIPEVVDQERIWEERFESIRGHELHLARNGTVVLKFWLNVSKAEQKDRFLKRIDDPERQWKFAEGDVRERGHWDQYMKAYEEALRATSRPWAPWYAVPADDKRHLRMVVAETIVASLSSLGLTYPHPGTEPRERFGRMRELLEGEAD